MLLLMLLLYKAPIPVCCDYSNHRTAWAESRMDQGYSVYGLLCGQYDDWNDPWGVVKKEWTDRPLNQKVRCLNSAIRAKRRHTAWSEYNRPTLPGILQALVSIQLCGNMEYWFMLLSIGDKVPYLRGHLAGSETERRIESGSGYPTPLLPMCDSCLLMCPVWI